MQKENLKAIKLIQDELKTTKMKSSSSSASIDPQKLQAVGVDTSQDNIQLRNLVLKKDMLFSKKFSINVIDKKRDWDGILISEHLALEEKLQKLLKQGKNRITYQELLDLKVDPPGDSYKLGKNIKMSMIFFSSDYTISLVDEKKDSYGRWRAPYVNAEKVSHALDQFRMTKKFYRNNSETKINDEIAKHLQGHFENVKVQSGNKKRFDIEIGNNDFVIEIKLAAAIKISKHGAVGQIHDYLKDSPREKFMLLLVGEKGEEDSVKVKNLIEECNQHFKCHWDFVYAQ